MEQVNTLEQARERMIRLLSEAESNSWEIGDLLNQVENQGLARRKGYGKTRTWLEAEVPGAAGKTTTLYRYAAVAAVYTKQHVELWGISKLELLMAHDQDVLAIPIQRTRAIARSSCFNRTARPSSRSSMTAAGAICSDPLRFGERIRRHQERRTTVAARARSVRLSTAVPEPKGTRFG